MRKLILTISFLVVIAPINVFSAENFSYGVWIPYWKRTGAIPEVTSNVSKLKVISPFSYEVQKNGRIWDAMKLKEANWLQLFELTGSEKVKIIPTVSWMKGSEIHEYLSSSTLRTAHIKNIISLVDQNDFDGVDIDYENKLAETKIPFVKFLGDLKKELTKRKKTLSCTIEPRTPLTSRFTVIPKDIEYANDFAQIGKICDEVRIMAYGQGSIDLKLNKKKRDGGAYYMPIADREWVEKVIQETLKTIKKEKVVLGVPNFGYEYEVVRNSSSTTIQYNRLRSVTFQDLTKIISLPTAKMSRNGSGELGITYTSSTGSLASSRFVIFSDSYAIQEKIKLAKKYNLKGVMIFRIDGEGDPRLWDIVK